MLHTCVLTIAHGEVSVYFELVCEVLKVETSKRNVNFVNGAGQQSKCIKMSQICLMCQFICFILIQELTISLNMNLFRCIFTCLSVFFCLFLSLMLCLSYIFLLSLSDPPPFLFSVSLCLSLTQTCWSAVSISVLPGGRIQHIRNLIQFIVIQSQCVPRGACGADPRVLVPDNSSPAAVKLGP